MGLLSATLVSCGSLLLGVTDFGAYAAPSTVSPAVKTGPAVITTEDIMSVQAVAGFARAQQKQGDKSVDSVTPHLEDDESFRIVNGIVTDSDLPWFASLNMITNMQPNGQARIGLCGGSLINKEWILTAAHCLYDVDANAYIKPEMLRTGPGVDDVTPNIVVQLGGNEQDFMISNNMVPAPEPRANATVPSIVTFGYVVNVTCFPGYDPIKQTKDICLVKLNEPVKNAPVRLNFETAARTAAQVDKNFAAGEPATAFGYGDTSFEGEMSGALLEATMPIVDIAECKKAWAYAMYGPKALTIPRLLNSVLGNDVVCVDSTKADTCQGDSGGPLLNANTGVQIGITSLGVDCQSGIPGVYTEVSAYQDWVFSVAGIVGP